MMVPRLNELFRSIEFADSYFIYKIKHPIPGYADLVIVIAIINGQLVAMTQDSKHGLKTDRNNLFTRAKLFTLGTHVAMYSYVWG
jgi:hypothetical protein